MKLLKDRTEPKRTFNRRMTIKQSEGGFSSAFNKKLTSNLERKMFKLVPPLKEYPEEIESEDSNASEDYE
jgi:hypothetical protein